MAIFDLLMAVRSTPKAMPSRKLAKVSISVVLRPLRKNRSLSSSMKVMYSL